MIRIKRFVNELMTSNCFIIYDDVAKGCIIVDPGSEKCKNEIAFIDKLQLTVDYIILTHEHTDHTWGCNTLIDKFNPKVICSEECKKALPKEGQAYFRFYYNDSNYEYVVNRVDYTIEELYNYLLWNGNKITFISTPGHSKGSICFSISNLLFSGDTIMQYRPFINKKNGSMEEYRESIENICRLYNKNTQIFPGHGNPFLLSELKQHGIFI